MIAPTPLIVAHRGYSGRQPEQTVAAYREAISWSEQNGTALLLECDVQFSGDDEIICLHDLTVDRTSNGSGSASELSMPALRGLDFGSWRTPNPTDEQRRLITLAELLIMVRDARDRGVPVELAIETKHPNPRGLDLEERIAILLDPYGWTAPGAPVRLLSFSLPALARMGELLPGLERTLLIEHALGEWSDGHLPEGVDVAGVDLQLLQADPAYIGRVLDRGGRVNAWTANSRQQIDFCLEHGVHLITTDFPARVLLRQAERG